MVFNDTTNKNGIIQMCELTTNLGSTAISGNSAQLAYFTNLINQWYRLAVYFVWKSDKSWNFDDSNHTTFSQPTTTLVDSQRDYTLPSTALRIRQVEVMNNSGDYYTLVYIPENSDLLKSEKEQETKGLPVYYRLVGNSIILDPKPDATMITAAAGLRLSLDREIDAFATADTMQEPGLAAAFHPILYYGPSYEWASVKGVVSVINLCQKMLGNFPGITDMLKDFYANRNQDKIPVISRTYQSYK